MLDHTGPSFATESNSLIMVDPVFFPPPQRFRYAFPDISSDLGSWLAQQVARSPRRLDLHVQRIVLHAEQGSVVQLMASLVDLFIVLGNAGHGLRKRLLDANRRRLPADMETFLQTHLSEALAPDTPLPMELPWSRLSLGLSGVSRLVSREQLSTSPHQPLEMAQNLLNDGNINEAMALLEQALMKTPDDSALQAELLATCRATRDSSTLRRLREKLSMDSAMHDDWDNTLSWLDQQEVRA